MYKFKTLMAGIDLTNDNASLLRYAFHVSQLFNSKRIHFVHVTDDLEGDKRQYAGEQPYYQYLKEQIQQKIRRYFSNDTIEILINVLEGKPEEQLLHWASVNEVDALLIGKPPLTENKKVTPYHLTRLAPCSVIIVPEQATTQLKQIFIPVDNSSYTNMSLEKVERLLSKNPSLQVTLYHAIPPPITFLVSNSPRYKQFVEELKNDVREEMKELVQMAEKRDNLTFEIAVCDDSAAECIIQKGQDLDADLIIMGSKGRTNTAAVLMGSITENVIKTNDKIPMFILRQKGERKSLIQELFQSNELYGLTS
jgi:nucleotide-binding universal stress UspA family protein